MSGCFRPAFFSGETGGVTTDETEEVMDRKVTIHTRHALNVCAMHLYFEKAVCDSFLHFRIKTRAGGVCRVRAEAVRKLLSWRASPLVLLSLHASEM